MKMKTLDQVDLLFTAVCEGEVPSWPYLRQTEDGERLAMFTYFPDEDPETGADVVLGYGREYRLEGDEIVSEEKDMFETEEAFIFLRDAREMTYDERSALLAQYCAAIDAYLAAPEDDALRRAVGTAFRQAVSGDALEMYRQNCPAFLARFGAEEAPGGNEA